MVIVSLCAPLAAQYPQPIFTLSFSPCASKLEAPAAAGFRSVFDCVLTTMDNATDQGAQGWALSVSSDAVWIVDVTTKGTMAAPVTDDPPGLLDRGFEKSDIAKKTGYGDCEGRLGAVSAVVLSFTEPVTLPPEGEAVIARITVAGVAPPAIGESYLARLLYVNGCVGTG